MVSRMHCDGCGDVIREGPRDRVERLRLLTVVPGALLDCTGDAYDFCNVHCLATWAVQQETETVR